MRPSDHRAWHIAIADWYRLMIIGLDFDNTIVCYDAIFHCEAVRRGLIAPAVPIDKTSVRDAIRRSGKEARWTELQGDVYGPLINGASPYDGCIDFIKACRRRQINVRIISHKSQFPYGGQGYDLRAAALSWLNLQGIIAGELLGKGDVYFEATREAKMARIARERCGLFIDDLPEFLIDPAFPSRVSRVLFDPAGRAIADVRYQTVASWREVADVVFAKAVA